MATFQCNSSICRNKACGPSLAWEDRLGCLPWCFLTLSPKLGEARKTAFSSCVPFLSCPKDLWNYGQLFSNRKEKFKSRRQKFRNFCEVRDVVKEGRSIAVSLPRRNQQNVAITAPLQQPDGQSVTARSVAWVEETRNNVERVGRLWWGDRGRIWGAKNVNPWEIRLH